MKEKHEIASEFELLEPVVTVRDERDIEKAHKVLQKSETNCLISNSIKARVVMKTVVRLETDTVTV